MALILKRLPTPEKTPPPPKGGGWIFAKDSEVGEWYANHEKTPKKIRVERHNVRKWGSDWTEISYWHSKWYGFCNVFVGPHYLLTQDAKIFADLAQSQEDENETKENDMNLKVKKSSKEDAVAELKTKLAKLEADGKPGKPGKAEKAKPTEILKINGKQVFEGTIGLHKFLFDAGTGQKVKQIPEDSTAVEVAEKLQRELISRSKACASAVKVLITAWAEARKAMKASEKR